jgi:glutaredoxin
MIHFKKALQYWFPVALAVIAFQNWGAISSFFFEPQDYSQYQSEPIVMYSTEWCGYCKKLRSFLDRSKLAYIEHDIEKSSEARKAYDGLKGGGIPLTVVNNTVIRGYNTRTIIKVLKADHSDITH